MRLSSVESKITRFHMLFFKAEVSSSSNFASFFSVMTHISSILFWLKHNILSTKVINQSANFQTCHFLHQNSPNSSSQLFFKLCFPLQCHQTWHSSVLFHSKLYMLWAEGAYQSASFQALTKFLILFFKLRVNFAFNFASSFSVMTNNFYEIF